MSDVRIVETRLQVAGVRTVGDVKKALQPLFDIFADEGIGQATFEVTDAPTATLVIKHQESASVDREAGRGRPVSGRRLPARRGIAARRPSPARPAQPTQRCPYTRRAMSSPAMESTATAM